MKLQINEGGDNDPNNLISQPAMSVTLRRGLSEAEES